MGSCIKRELITIHVEEAKMLMRRLTMMELHFSDAMMDRVLVLFGGNVMNQDIRPGCRLM